ncbi:MAG: hypothetical protein GY851_35575 [bacterium]|nr:hypothetical protein [bacterium]
MTKQRQNEMTHLLLAAIKRADGYVAIKSDNPQVKEMQAQSRGAANAYRAALDFVRGDAVLLKMDARGMI